MLSHSWSSLAEFFLSCSFPFPSERVLPLGNPPPQGNQVSTGLGASSQAKVRQGSPLLNSCFKNLF